MNSGPVPVLLYHAVVEAEDESDRFSVTRAAFEQQLDLVLETGGTCLQVSEYAEMLRGERRLPANPILVTFDDGYANFLEFAVPALKARGIPSTLYVPTSALANDDENGSPFPGTPMMRGGDLSTVEDLGVEIGAHSHTHRQLDTLPRVEARDEIRHSKTVLEDLLGHEVASFAYPHGYSDQAVRRCVEESGYRSACAVRNALSSSSDNVYAIARLSLESTTSCEVVASWLRGEGAPVARGGEQLRTRLWRICRRAMQWLPGPIPAPVTAPAGSEAAPN